MANVNFFSPDGGTTRYPIEDTEARSRIAGQQNQLNAQGVLGAKNLLKVVATSQTVNGVTFTINRDNNGNVLNINVNGTATANTNLGLIPYDDIDLNLLTNKTLLLSGCPSGGGSNAYGLEVYYNDGQEHWFRDYGDGVEISIPSSGLTNINPNIMVRNGATVNNLVFYPMLRLASDPDDTYVPYVMTNRELTEKKAGLYTKGDTVQCGASLVGHVTTGTTKLELTLRGNFDKANISNVSVGTTPLLIRGINGYLKTNNDVELNNILFSNYLKLDNAYIYPHCIDLRISLIDGGAFTNVTNNTLIDIQNMTLILS